MTLRLSRLASCAVCCLVFAAGARAGQTLRVEPGKWEIRIESKSSLQPQPQVRTLTECVTENEFDPDKLMEGVEGCSVSDVTSSADRLQWKLRCALGGGEMTGEADYRSQGDTVEGAMHIAMQAGGMSMTMDHAYTGKRVGDCE